MKFLAVPSCGPNLSDLKNYPTTYLSLATGEKGRLFWLTGI